jgi:alkylation response protein AidB-like acyl-CoA dehydrogenase
MTLLYSDVEDELRASIRQLLVDRSPWRSVLERAETEEPYDRALWRALAADVGCAGLAVPEKWGGAVASWREIAVVFEELGRAVAPVPFLGGALATAALLACDETEAHTELLATIAAGERAAVLVLPLSTPPQAPVPTTVRVGNRALTGTVTSIADALAADVLVVPTPDGLYAVEARQATLTPVTSLDLTRQLCDVRFDGTPATPLAAADRVGTAWAAALTTGAALLASEQLGSAEWCLETTVGYLKNRHQFGRPVGSFQGLKHRLAELWVALTQARALARYAAGCVADDDPDAPVAASLAQAHCSQVAVRAAEECVQMHGGIGFTWEHPAHLYLKRAKADAIALGTPERHRAALATLVNLPPGANRE